MSKLTEIIGHDKFARFTHYCEGELWFTCDGTDFSFRIPLVDTEGATFFACERTTFYMKWIRKELELLEKAREEQGCD